MTTSNNLYERLLAEMGDAARRPKPAIPRPSASVVPWRRVAGQLEVFWVQRAESLPFMGGWYAFPGGGLAPEDREVPVSGTPQGMDDPEAISPLPETLTEHTDRPPPDRIPGLAAGALRELFEETGILVSRGPSSLPPTRLEEDRKRLLARGVGFAQLVAELGASLDASRLVWAGRWVTPPFGPLRFDNRFFLLEWPSGAAIQPTVLGREARHGEWVHPADALARWGADEIMAAPPVLHILQVLAEEGPEDGLARLRDPADVDLGPFRRVEFVPGLLVFPLATPTLPPAAHTNCYLVGTADAILVDPGSPFDTEIERLQASLEQAHRRLGRRVTAIWLTHHHPDHTGGVAVLRRHLQVPVCAHPLTAERLAALGVDVDLHLQDGHRLELDGEPHITLQAVHTPGHARGHLCFFETRRRWLLAGDMVAGLGTIVVDPPEGDMDDYLASLERLLALKPRLLFPAHGPVHHRATDKLQEYLEHRRWRENRVLEAWRAGLRSASEMLPRVYDDVPKTAYPLAERQIEAHLDRLRRRGKIESPHPPGRESGV